MENEEWKDPIFRASVAAELAKWSPHKEPIKIEQANVMERFLFLRSKTSQDYHDAYTKVVQHYKKIASKSIDTELEPNLLNAIEYLGLGCE